MDLDIQINTILTKIDCNISIKKKKRTKKKKRIKICRPVLFISDSSDNELEEIYCKSYA
jgi:hypothetical protein